MSENISSRLTVVKYPNQYMEELPALSENDLAISCQFLENTDSQPGHSSHYRDLKQFPIYSGPWKISPQKDMSFSHLSHIEIRIDTPNTPNFIRVAWNSLVIESDISSDSNLPIFCLLAENQASGVQVECIFYANRFYENFDQALFDLQFSSLKNANLPYDIEFLFRQQDYRTSTGLTDG